MKYQSIKDFLFYACLIICCALAYFIVPGNIPFRLAVGAVPALIIYSVVLHWLARQHKEFAADMAEDILSIQSRSALSLMKKDGSFFTTPKASLRGYAHLQSGIPLSLLLLGLGYALLISPGNTIAYLSWPTMGLGMVTLVYAIISSLRVNPTLYKQVTFYQNHLEFLPQKKVVPYTDLEYIHYYSRGIVRGSWSFKRIIIRYKGADHTFEWNEWFTLNPLDPIIFKYFGFEETGRSLAANAMAFNGFQQTYVYNPALAPSDKVSRIKEASKMNELLTLLILLAVIVGVSCYGYFVWKSGL